MLNFMVFMIVLFAMGIVAYRVAGRYTKMTWSDIWTLDNLKYIPLTFLVMLVVSKPTIVDPLLSRIGSVHKWIMSNILQVSNADPYFGLLIVTAIFGIFVYICYKLILAFANLLSGVDQDKAKLTAKIVAAAMFSASGLHLLKGSVDFVTYVLTVSSVVFAILLLTIISNWRGNLQDKYGLAIGYLCNIFMFWLLCWTNSGLDIYRNITGSLAVALPFLMFNFCVVVILDKFFDPTIPMRKKLAYKTNYVGTVLMSCLFLLMTITLIFGKVDRYDLMMAHTNNQIINAMEDIEKREVFSQKVNGMSYPELQAKMKAAIQSDDKDALMTMKESNDKFFQDIEDVKKIQAKRKYRYLIPVESTEIIMDTTGLLVKGWSWVFEPDDENGGMKLVMVPIFEKTYTDTDADEYGNVYTFPWNSKIHLNDKFIVEASLPNKNNYDIEEVKIWNGKDAKPKWSNTNGGYFNKPIIEVHDWGKAAIRIPLKKGVVVKVRVEREKRIKI